MKNIKIEDKKYFIGIIIMVVLMILLIISAILFKNRDKTASTLNEYSRDYFYMDTVINVKLYGTNKERADEVLDDIDDLYKTFHNYTDRYNSHEQGLYELNNGNTKISSELRNMIIYGSDWYKKSNGLLNIGIGNVVDIWKKYREQKTGVPTLEELQKVNINFNDIVITDDNITLKNGVKIDLGAISKGYTTELIATFLKNVGFDKFIINAGGNVSVGNYYKKTDTNYKVGIEDPTNNSQIYKIVKVNNKAVVTSGGYQRNYTYNGVTYNHIINPNTLFPADNVLSVTVITNSSADADALSTILFLMNVEEGKEFIKNYDAEAIWYLKDGQTEQTEGFSKYE